jgi:hypothetical protein
MQDQAAPTEENMGLLLIEADDRDLGSALVYRGKVVIEVNYDEHGSAGAELVRQTAERLAVILETPVTKEDMSDDDYKNFMGFS